MAAFTIDSGLQAALDKASYPFREQAQKIMHTASPILDILAKKKKKALSLDKNDPGTDDKFSGFDTFYGTDVEEPVYIGSLQSAADLAAKKKGIFVTDGDEVKPENTDTSAIWAKWSKADIGAAMQLTLTEQQKIEQFVRNKTIQGIVNLLDQKWGMWVEELKYQIADAIYNGQGASASPRPELEGLSKIHDSSYAYGLSASDFAAFPNWNSFYYDLEQLGGSLSSFLGYTTKTQLDSVAELISTTNSQRPGSPIIIDMLRRFIQVLRAYNRGKAPDIITCRRSMLDMVRDAAYSQDATAFAYGTNTYTAKQFADMGYEDAFDIGGQGTVIIADDTSILRAGSKTINFTAPDGVFDFHYLDDYRFKANDLNNFKITDWEPIPGRYNVMQKIITASVVFYNIRRDRCARLKLPDAFSSAS